MIASSTLVLHETMLGALMARLEDSRTLKLHASDFHSAVEQLGLSFGSRVSPPEAVGLLVSILLACLLACLALQLGLLFPV